MGFFDRLHKGNKKENSEEEKARRLEEEQQEAAEKQRKEHEKLSWPKVRPLSAVRVKDDQGNERQAEPLQDPVPENRKDEIGPLVFQPKMNGEAIRFLSVQELIFLLTTMESFHKEAPLADFESNRRIVYNEIISRLRDARHIYVILDLTTGYPFLDHGYALVYSEREYAHAAANVYAAQYRRVVIQGAGGENEPTVGSFFEFLYYMGAEHLLLDNGYYGARIDRSQIVAPPNVTGTEKMPPVNPPLNFALCDFLSEVRWPVKYDRRDAILHEKESKMWSLIRSSHFIVPMQQEGPVELVGDKLKLGKDSRLRFPMVTGPDGKTYLPVFTDGPEFSKKYAREGWNGAAFQWKDVLSLITERDGVIVNPMTHKAVLSKERIAQMETAAALQNGGIHR
ncbi:MAG: SseB family protein [Lachnospiraceae bacterium]|nr:SseB family protein [Lachnospiraceae bacterium]